MAVDVLEGEAWRRAVEGGSDQLLMFLLRSNRPQVYRERGEVRVDVRRMAEQVAAEIGVPVEQVLEHAERLSRGAR